MTAKINLWISLCMLIYTSIFIIYVRILGAVKQRGNYSKAYRLNSYITSFSSPFTVSCFNDRKFGDIDKILSLMTRSIDDVSDKIKRWC